MNSLRLIIVLYLSKENVTSDTYRKAVAGLRLGNLNQEGSNRYYDNQKQEGKARSVNSQNSTEMTSLVLSRETETSLQQINGASQFRKSLLQKVKAARENSQDESTPQHRKPPPSSACQVPEFARNRTPTLQRRTPIGGGGCENSYDIALKQNHIHSNGDYGNNPFTSGVEGEFGNALNKMTPKFLKEKSNSFKLKRNKLSHMT